MTSVSSFLYRLPRFDVNFPLEFSVGTNVVVGRCLKLSNTGLMARFVYPLEEGSVGSLHLKPANRMFELRAIVTHTDGLRSGLQFAFANNQEQQVIRALVDTISHGESEPR